MDKVAVLIPCYNESITIEKVVRDYRRVLPEAVIYVYDNNSTDGTDRIARDAGAIVRYEYRQGKGNVIRSMFRDIEAQCYLMIDGDDTYPAEDAPQMIDLVLNKGVDMVIGDRLSSTYFTENKRPFHNSGNLVVRGLINRLFRSNVKDIMTGYRVKGAMLSQYENSVRTNSYWHNNIRLYELLGKDLITEQRSAIENLTLEDFNAFMRTLYDGSNRIQVNMHGVSTNVK